MPIVFIFMWGCRNKESECERCVSEWIRLKCENKRCAYRLNWRGMEGMCNVHVSRWRDGWAMWGVTKTENHHDALHRFFFLSVGDLRLFCCSFFSLTRTFRLSKFMFNTILKQISHSLQRMVFSSSWTGRMWNRQRGNWTNMKKDEIQIKKNNNNNSSRKCWKKAHHTILNSFCITSPMW